MRPWLVARPRGGADELIVITRGPGLSCPPHVPRHAMKQPEAEELLSCLPAGRTLFTYGKDWYAISLLRMKLHHTGFSELKHSSMANLLAKPRVRSWLGMLGKKSVAPADLAMLYPEDAETSRLTTGLFSGWCQTSRRTNLAWNIVLQLNLNEDDARLMDKQFPVRDDDPFERYCHPVHRGRHRTLAWARIDLDWITGEALIEEIQNDRLREVRRAVERIRRNNLAEVPIYGENVSATFILNYWEKRLRISRQCWDEAMLSAAIGFIANELGIRRIYYHSPLSRAKLKRDGAADAPSSLYTDLPRKFCFERTTDLPAFLKRRRRTGDGLWMHRLVL